MGKGLSASLFFSSRLPIYLCFPNTCPPMLPPSLTWSPALAPATHAPLPWSHLCVFVPSRMPFLLKLMSAPLHVTRSRLPGLACLVRTSSPPVSFRCELNEIKKISSIEKMPSKRYHSLRCICPFLRPPRRAQFTFPRSSFSRAHLIDILSENFHSQTSFAPSLSRPLLLPCLVSIYICFHQPACLPRVRLPALCVFVYASVCRCGESVVTERQVNRSIGRRTCSQSPNEPANHEAPGKGTGAELQSCSAREMLTVCVCVCVAISCV